MAKWGFDENVSRVRPKVRLGRGAETVTVEAPAEPAAEESAGSPLPPELPQTGETAEAVTLPPPLAEREAAPDEVEETPTEPAEPVAEPVAELVSEPVAEATEPLTETVVEPVTEPVVTEEPRRRSPIRDFITARANGVAPEPSPLELSDAVDDEPAAEPVFESEPVTASAPVVAPEPVLAPEPVMASAPVVAPEPVIASAPVVAPEPAMAPAPVIAPAPVPPISVAQPPPPPPAPAPVLDDAAVNARRTDIKRRAAGLSALPEQLDVGLDFSALDELEALESAASLATELERALAEAA